jgi:phenylacetate-CoA ligase
MSRNSSADAPAQPTAVRPSPNDPGRDTARGLALNLARLVLGKTFGEAFDSMLRVQWLTGDQLRARTEQRLTALLQHASIHVPFYRECFAGLGVALPSAPDLASLPILTKTRYREREASTFCAENVSAHQLIPRTTSGSSGEPFGFFVDRNAVPMVFASHLFYDSWHGLRPLDRRVRIMTPAPLAVPLPRTTPLSVRIRDGIAKSVRGLYDSYAEERIPIWAVDPERTREIWRRMEQVRPDYVIGYTSSLATIAGELTRLELRLSKPVKAIVTIAETLSPARRRVIEEYFGGAPIINRYGLREFGWWVAQSCRESPDHFHVNTELAVCEIVRNDGSPCNAGETGRVVITDLHNYARPFIRYDTGDLASMSGEPCPCGRGFPLMGAIEGRSIEHLRLRNGKVVTPPVLGQFLFVNNDHLDSVQHYQLIQESLDSVRLLVVPTDRWSEQRRAKLHADLVTLLGRETRVVVETVRDIAAERSGKRPIIKVAPGVARQAHDGSVETPAGLPA